MFFGSGLSLNLYIPFFLSFNIFKRADFLEFVVKGSIGSSKNVTTSNDFFNLIEFGSDINLNIPKIVFPFNINSIIPRSSSPKTKIIIGTSIQENVGLDRQNFASKIVRNYRHGSLRSRTWILSPTNLAVQLWSLPGRCRLDNILQAGTRLTDDREHGLYSIALGLQAFP